MINNFRVFFLTFCLIISDGVVAMQNSFTEYFIARNCRQIQTINQQLGRQNILNCNDAHIRIGAHEQLYIDLSQYDVTGIILERLHISATYRQRPLLVIRGNQRTSLVQINSVTVKSEGGMVFDDAFLCIDLSDSEAKTRVITLRNNEFYINNLEIVSLIKGKLQHTKGCFI